MATIITQDGFGEYNIVRIIGARVFYWPQLREGDPDVSYDVMLETTAKDILGGRYLTLARAEEVRDEVVAAIETPTDYTLPAS